MGNLLEVRNLVCGYGQKEVLEGISFSVKEADFLGIIGPNGAGKTTLFRAITRVLKPWKGQVIYNGRNILRVSPRDLAREVAILPQILEISFSFSVEEFVLMGRFPHLGRFERLREKDRRVADQAMALADVAQFRDRKIFELSGGERQRVILAQGFAQQPRLLLLDEPTAHLDIGHQVEILDLVKKLNRETALTVIMVLHDLNLASEYCDRLILLNVGKIFTSGSPKEVLSYQSIEEVYKTVVLVDKNPISSKPHILLVPEEERTEQAKNKIVT